MKRAGLIAAEMLLAVLCAAQMPPPHAPVSGGTSQGVMSSSRMDFGMQCGIADSSPRSAARFTRAGGGNWSVMSADQRREPTDNGMARVWREHNWMVDMHDSPEPGMAVTRMHTGQMCFDAQGRIVRMIDRYVDMPKCNCMRYTALSFDEASGRVVRREQRFVNATTGSEIAAPEMAKDFPEVWQFRKLAQLPFYSLMNH